MTCSGCNFKRAGVAPRAGRIGLPDDSCGHAVNVDCADYFTSIPDTQPVIGSREHSWHIGDPVFTQDMIDTINGVDRASPARASAWRNTATSS